MKVRRMGITEILRRIWLFSANKIKILESGSKQPTQLIIAAHNCHNDAQSEFSSMLCRVLTCHRNGHTSFVSHFQASNRTVLSASKVDMVMSFDASLEPLLFLVMAAGGVGDTDN